MEFIKLIVSLSNSSYHHTTLVMLKKLTFKLESTGIIPFIFTFENETQDICHLHSSAFLRAAHNDNCGLMAILPSYFAV